jgi:hypothetical protein
MKKILLYLIPDFKPQGFLFRLGFITLISSPTISFLAITSSIKSHRGYLPKIYQMNWYEVLLYLFAMLWQVSAIYALIVGQDTREGE